MDKEEPADQFYTRNITPKSSPGTSPLPDQSPSSSPMSVNSPSPFSPGHEFGTHSSPQLELIVSDSEDCENAELLRDSKNTHTAGIQGGRVRDRVTSPVSAEGREPWSEKGRTEGTGPRRTEGDLTFKIRNTDTGEEIDLRDENKANFTQKLAKVLSESPKSLEDYCKQKRKVNEQLWKAIKDNDSSECRRLLDQSLLGEMTAQPNAKGLDDWTALHLAANTGSVDICELLLTAAQVEVDAKSTTHRTPLHISALCGFPDVLDMLLQHGADINAMDNDGYTALHLAASLGHFTTVQRLLNYDPDFTLTNRMEKTSYDLSATPEIKALFETCFEQRDIHLNPDTYSRTCVGGVFMHNSREDMITKILYKAFNRTDPQALRICFERSVVVKVSERSSSPLDSPSTRESSFKQSVQTVLVEEEAKVEPASLKDFTPICQLGRGSFGEVFLIRKNSSGEQFAMKLLRKDRIMRENLLRYAVTERNVLTYMKHPFIVGLKYAFQTSEKLVLVLDYCPGGSLGSILLKEKR